MKNIFINGFLALVAVGLLFGVYYVSLPQKVTPIEKDPLLSEREIIDSQVVSNTYETLVRYAYVGKKVPEKITPDEIVELRTESSYTRKVGEREGEYTLSLTAYPQKTFIKRDDGWHYIEYGNTTQQQFDMYHSESPLSWLIKTAFADSVSTGTILSGAGDGHVCRNNGDSTWAAAHDAADAVNCADYTSTEAVIYSVYFNPLKTDTYGISRGFLPFDTSSIPWNATITAASLAVFASSTNNVDNDGADYITIVQTSQGTHSSLAIADYDQCGAVSSPTEGVDTGQRKDIDSISTQATLTFTLNSTGRGWIKKYGQSSNCSSTTGITCLGLREGHDTTNSAIVVSDVLGNLLRITTSEWTGTDKDPSLSVTYTTPFAFWQFWDF